MIGKYLNTDWKTEPIGRSPMGIASRLSVSVKDVNTTLKSRYNSLLAIAERMPFEDVLVGGDIVDWNVDPYIMVAHFSGIDEEGNEKNISLSESDMLSVLQKMQSGT